METAQLYQSLTFLSYATGIIIILVGGMIIKVLFDLSKLTGTINETAVILKEELTPILKNVNKTVEIVSSIVIKTDENINKLKNIITKSPLSILTKLSSLTGSLAKGFWSGITTAFKIFGKKK